MHVASVVVRAGSCFAKTKILPFPVIIQTHTTSSMSSNASPQNIDSSTATRLARFEQSMESIYGSFRDIKTPEEWTPPAKSGGHRGRYLWTDAFGVINFITLYREWAKSSTSADKYLTLARRLVDTVHEVLGHTRDGKARLAGATDENPLGGGLRIGKFDEAGVDGDGQYHHYLTIWMFALNRLSLATAEPQYNNQAVALARAIHPRFFVNRESTRPRMVWKMSMDLAVALVPSEGNLDPIDGYVVFRLLQATSMATGNGQVLDEEIADYKRVMERKGEHFVSTDPLDLGMTLWTSHWFADSEAWASKLAGKCFQQICMNQPTHIRTYIYIVVWYYILILIFPRRALRDRPLPLSQHQISPGLPRVWHQFRHQVPLGEVAGQGASLRSQFVLGCGALCVGAVYGSLAVAQGCFTDTGRLASYY